MSSLQPPWEKKNDVWSFTRPGHLDVALLLEHPHLGPRLRAEVAVDDERLAVRAQRALQGLDADAGVAELEAAEPVGLGEQDRPVPRAHQEPVVDAALEVVGELA